MSRDKEERERSMLPSPPVTSITSAELSLDNAQDDETIYAAAEEIKLQLFKFNLNEAPKKKKTLKFLVLQNTDAASLLLNLKHDLKTYITIPHNIEYYSAPEPYILITMAPSSHIHNICPRFFRKLVTEWTANINDDISSRLEADGGEGQPLLDGSILEADGIIYLRPASSPSVKPAEEVSSAGSSSSKQPIAHALPDSSFPLVVAEVSSSQDREDAVAKIDRWIRGSEGHIKLGVLVDYTFRAKKSSSGKTVEDFLPKKVYVRAFIGELRDEKYQAKAIGLPVIFDPSVTTTTLSSIPIPPGTLFAGHAELRVPLKHLRELIVEAAHREFSIERIRLEVRSRKAREDKIEAAAVEATEKRMEEEEEEEEEEEQAGAPAVTMDLTGRRSKRKIQSDATVAASKAKEERYQIIISEERIKAKAKYDK